MDFGGGIIPSVKSDDFLLKLFNRQVPAGRRKYWEHHHAQFEITLFKQGEGTYDVGGKRYDIRPGDIFLFSSHEIHCITDIKDGADMILMNLHFQPRFILSANNDTFDAKFLKIFFARNNKFENRLDRANPSTAEIAGIMLEIEKELEEKNPEYELMVKVNLLRLLVTVIRRFDYVDATEAYTVKGRHVSEIEKAVMYIDGNLAADISLDDLSRAAGISKSYFSTVFKRLYGISPWDYITAKRVESAMRILEKEDKTMLEVACMCGFNSTANFNRAFKMTTGKTPSEYKEEV